MLNKFLIVLVALISVNVAFAQDIIRFKNGRSIEAKILEINEETVRYKKTNYLDGPDINAPISKVVSITYANGETEVFDESETPAPAAAPAEPAPVAAQEPAPAPVAEQPEPAPADEQVAQQPAVAPEPQYVVVPAQQEPAAAPAQQTAAAPAEQPAAAPAAPVQEPQPVKKKKLAPIDNPESGWYQAKRNAFGIWLQPLGVVLWGPLVGISYRHTTAFTIDVHVRIPELGIAYWAIADEPDDMTGIAFGAQFRKIFATRNGGWLLGAFFDLGYTEAVYNQGQSWEKEEYWVSFVVAANGGYRFRFGRHFYMDLGLVLGTLVVSDQDWRYSNPVNDDYSSDYDHYYDGYVEAFGMLVFTTGFEF